jgi:hypothetical protein
VRAPELKVLETKQFGGLEIEQADLNRTPSSWRLLSGWDQLVSGAIRKTESLLDLGFQFDAPILAITNYRRTATSQLFVLGISAVGTIYNLETGLPITFVPIGAGFFPYVGEMTGLDGTETIKYLVVTTNDTPYKWNGASAPTVIGVSPPPDPIRIAVLNLTNSPDRGIPVLVGRRYRYTFWNPATKHESSPSPDSPLDPTTFESLISPTARVHATPNLPYIAQVALIVPNGGNPPVYGAGYTHMRLYATKDGGDVFFLVRDVVTESGSISPVFAVSDDDGAFRIPGNLIYDGVADLTLDSTQFGGAIPNGQMPNFGGAFAPRSPAPDPILVDPAPDPGENDPPPKAAWGATYQGRLFLVDQNILSSLRFSKIQEFESFPVDSVFQLTSDQFDPIIALDAESQYLIVGKGRSSVVIQGTDFTDFVELPLDSQVNFRARRGLTRAQGVMFFVSQQGLMTYAGGSPNFYGRPVRPLTDAIPDATALNGILMATHSKRGIVLLATDAVPFEPLLILVDFSQTSPFSTFPLPQVPTAMQEVELSDGSKSALLALDDGRVYKVFGGQADADAIAEMQLQPQDQLQMRKTFRRLRVEEPPPNLLYSCSVDGLPFTLEFPVQLMNQIGLTGGQLTVRFRHPAGVPLADPILLSNYRVEYVTIGERRGNA